MVCPPPPRSTRRWHRRTNGRDQTPEDIGALTAFLAGDGAANITGQVIAVDGGATLNYAGR
jgi:NAD(P)-dependent dehydrogenase (short-subunit alcohol dehydrogenase family)